jgi:hypothetical protein
MMRVAETAKGCVIFDLDLDAARRRRLQERGNVFVRGAATPDNEAQERLARNDRFGDRMDPEDILAFIVGPAVLSTCRSDFRPAH